MKSAKFLIVLTIIAFIPACADLTKIVSGSAFLGAQIQSGDVFKNIKSVELSNTEIQIVNHAQNKADLFITKWKGVIANPKAIAEIDQGMLGDYSNLRKRYSEVYAVVLRNWDKYDQQSKDALLGIHVHAKELDQSIDKYIAAKDKEMAVIQIIRYASVLASMAMGIVK